MHGNAVIMYDVQSVHALTQNLAHTVVGSTRVNRVARSTIYIMLIASYSCGLAEYM